MASAPPCGENNVTIRGFHVRVVQSRIEAVGQLTSPVCLAFGEVGLAQQSQLPNLAAPAVA